MKKYVGIILALLIVFSVTSCHEAKAEEAEGADDVTSEEVTAEEPSETENTNDVASEMVSIFPVTEYKYIQLAGSYNSQIMLNDDLTFNGQWNEYGDNVVVPFKGKFGNVEKIGDYGYKATMEEFELPEGDYDYSPLLTIENFRVGCEIEFLLPGYPVSELGEKGMQSMNWFYMDNPPDEIQIPCLYNVETGEIYFKSDEEDKILSQFTAE